jgi:tRNA modification GTPase
VDYPDDDIPELETDVLEESLQMAEETLRQLLGTYDAGRVLREGVDTAIVGSPNVGKSTVMNLLSGCERSIVTPIAGTTRDVVEETVRVGEICLKLSDTAGIRETDDTVEAIGVERSRKRMNSAALVLAVFDASRPLSEDDRTLIEALPQDTTIAILNKQDLKKQIDDTVIRKRFVHVIEMQANCGGGTEALSEAIATVTGVAGLSDAEPILANERQRHCTVRAAENLAEARMALIGGMTLDAVSVNIDEALTAILELTGERATEAVVDGIFARFCVGK